MPTIKLATFNMNNLFERVKVMELDGFNAEAKAVLEDVKKLNALLEKSSYAGATGTRIVELLIKYFFVKKGSKFVKKENPYIYLNEVREKLYSVSQDGSGPKLKAAGRAAWFGWVDFKKSDTNDIAIINTARVMDAVKADIVCCVEIDNRLALNRFSEIIKKEFGFSYPHTMCIDGNDERGIDVGVISAFPLGSMVSHVDDLAAADSRSKIFSRDCPEYEILLNKNTSLYLLCNHFKSKGYGSPATSNARRKLQADAVAEILKKYDLKNDLVVVAGDFNDTPDSPPLAHLLATPNLHDVLKSPVFNGPTWTYHSGNDQIDYLLVSKPIFDALQSVGIERRGIHKRGNVSFPEVDSKAHQASDHACVWASFSF